ncbi:MAG: ABC transporter substrate-binding protein [Planctomycetaceae bacterium]
MSAGCRNGGPAPDSTAVRQPYAGTKVHVVLPSELELASAWTPGFEDWAASAAASYSVSEVETSNSAIAEEHWLQALQAETPTLVVLPTHAVNRLLADDLAAPIPEAVLAADAIQWNSVPPAVRKALGMQGDRPAALAVTSASLVAFYRKDLLSAAGREIPQTWEEYDKLVATIAEWAPGHVAVEPRGPNSLATLFLARAAAGAKTPTQYSFELDVSTGDPLISSAAFVRALEAMTRLSSHLTGQSGTASFADCTSAALSGKAAMGITAFGADAGLAGDAVSPGEPPAVMDADLEFTPLPGSREVYNRDRASWDTLDGNQLNRPALCGFGGVCVCVMKSASDIEQEAAWDLWGGLLAIQDEGIVSVVPGIPVRATGLADAIKRAAQTLPAAAQRSLEQAISANHQNPLLVAELPCAGREQLLAVLADSVRQALDEGADAQHALDQAAGSWSGLLDELGRRRVLNSYRRRLGLSPLP